MPGSRQPGGESDGHSHKAFESPDELTGTPGRIQLAATNASATVESEQDAAIIESFISTLARIALSAAARQKDQTDQSD